MSYGVNYFLREVKQNMQRNPLMNLATISNILILSLCLGVFLIIIWNLNNITSTTVIQQLVIVARLEKNVTVEDMTRIRNEFKSLPSVTEVTYISKERALQELQEKMKKQVDLSDLKHNPLPNYFRIKVKNENQIGETALQIKKIAGIEEVKYGEGLTEKILALNKVIKIVGFFIIILLIIVNVLVVSNTIRLTVFARSKEIRIMQLVGAANWFIRWPFIIEGMLQGVIGSTLSIIIIALVYPELASQFHQQLPFMQLVNSSIIITKLSIQLTITGIVVGIIGSLISVNKFLHL